MGDNDTRYQPESGRWTPGCNQKDPQDICERRQANRPPVVSPFPEETILSQCSYPHHDTLRLRFKNYLREALGDYSRILVVLTSHQG